MPSTRQMLCTTSSGALFAIAWILFIDGAVTAKDSAGSNYLFKDYVPGLLATLCLFTINLVQKEEIDGGSSMGGFGGGDDDEGNRAKIVFFFGTLFGLGAVMAALWILIQDFPGGQWAGLALLFQTLLLIGSTVVLFVGRGAPREEF